MIDSGSQDTALGARDRAILEVFYGTAVRQSELIGLMLPDVDLDHRLLTVRCGKGGNQRVVPLTRLAVHSLTRYFTRRPSLATTDSPQNVFLSRFGTALSPTAVTGVVKKYARLAGLDHPVTCHLWRHTCATHLLLNGANIRHVQELLGHARLTTTERYLHLTILDLQQTHSRCHPREKMIDRGHLTQHNRPCEANTYSGPDAPTPHYETSTGSAPNS